MNEIKLKNGHPFTANGVDTNIYRIKGSILEVKQGDWYALGVASIKNGIINIKYYMVGELRVRCLDINDLTLHTCIS